MCMFFYRVETAEDVFYVAADSEGEARERAASVLGCDDGAYLGVRYFCDVPRV